MDIILLLHSVSRCHFSLNLLECYYSPQAVIIPTARTRQDGRTNADWVAIRFYGLVGWTWTLEHEPKKSHGFHELFQRTWCSLNPKRGFYQVLLNNNILKATCSICQLVFKNPILIYLLIWFSQYPIINWFTLNRKDCSSAHETKKIFHHKSPPSF